MNKARVIIDPQLLADVLCFPDGTRIVRMREEPDSAIRCGLPQLEIVVEHPDLPSSKIGEIIPLANPMFKGIKTRTEFAGWGCS